MPEPLAPGHEIRCPHCRRWHVVATDGATEGTPYALDMLYWHCGRLRYYAGQIGGAARYPTRTPTAATPTTTHTHNP